MIFDHITNAHIYAPLGRRIGRALDYLKQTDLAALEPGRYEIEGASLYAVVSEYSTREPGGGRWEAHRRYIDLQYLVRGTERIGHAQLDRLHAEPYDEQKDVMWVSGSGQFVTLEPGDFMILWPHDAHMPGIARDVPAPVKKIVVKIAVQEM
jgi:YhcH/YjgK/YiaL family protein